MTYLEWWSCFGIFGGATVVALLCTPVAIRLAKRLDVLDVPAAGKSHKTPVPYLGGSAMVISFVVAAVVAELLVSSDPRDVSNLAVCIAIAVCLAVLGLVDDLRGLSPWPRLALEICAGLGVWMATHGAWIPGPRPFQAVATVCWVVIITNAFNLLDNMDGLAAGIAAVSSLFLFALALENGQFLLASLALGLAGCALGFLRYNFHPARIYMGDSGSLFLGFMLAVLSLDLRPPITNRVTFMVPVLIVGVAVFDTMLVSIARVFNGRTPLQGGLDHVSHRLVFVGLSIRATVYLLYGVAVALGWIALIITRSDVSIGLVLSCLLAVIALAGGLMLAHVPVYGEAGNAEAPARADPTRADDRYARRHSRRLALRDSANAHRALLGDARVFSSRRSSVMGGSSDSGAE